MKFKLFFFHSFRRFFTHIEVIIVLLAAKVVILFRLLFIHTLINSREGRFLPPFSIGENARLFGCRRCF